MLPRPLPVLLLNNEVAHARALQWGSCPCATMEFVPVRYNGVRARALQWGSCPYATMGLLPKWSKLLQHCNAG
jgi:hypothetical protein